MATGSLSFLEASSGVIFREILDRAPVPPVRLNPEHTIDEALEKGGTLVSDHGKGRHSGTIAKLFANERDFNETRFRSHTLY